MTAEMIELKEKELNGVAGGRYHVITFDENGEHEDVRHFYFRYWAEEEIRHNRELKKKCGSIRTALWTMMTSRDSMSGTAVLSRINSACEDGFTDETNGILSMTRSACCMKGQACFLIYVCT